MFCAKTSKTLNNLELIRYVPDFQPYLIITSATSDWSNKLTKLQISSIETIQYHTSTIENFGATALFEVFFGDRNQNLVILWRPIGLRETPCMMPFGLFHPGLIVLLIKQSMKGRPLSLPPPSSIFELQQAISSSPAAAAAVTKDFKDKKSPYGIPDP